MSTTRASQHIKATRQRVFQALTDPRDVAQWKVPYGMTSQVHEMDAREGGTFRVSLTYTGQGAGKTAGHTDTYHGHYVKLVPGEQVVEVMEFETQDPELKGEMKVTYTLSDSDGGTDLQAVHENVPAGVSRADNELGWRLSMAKLARMLEGS